MSRRRRGQIPIPEDSQLPFYSVTKLDLTLNDKSFNAYVVRCQRRACGHWFIVHARKWLAASPYRARACPACFKPSRIPDSKDRH